MLYLHPDSLSPDPTYGKQPRPLSGNRVGLTVYPHALIGFRPATPALCRWRNELNLFRRPPPLKLNPGPNPRQEFLLDFGTELDGGLEIELTATDDLLLLACFGESIPEAEGLVTGHHPDPTFHWHLRRGRRRLTVPQRGFRFVRLVFHEIRKPLTIHEILTRAEFTFRERSGDFHCSDRRFQRVWQSSVYSARLCTRETTIWDGIKRDRFGWYGDARIIKLAADNVFFDPRPAEAMLSALPTGQWANAIPNYSFDAVAMLKQHILFYGLGRPCIRPCYDKIKALLSWIRRTQLTRGGFIRRTDQPLFGEIGFVDWSPMPPGGRLEELCWLQCKYLEALRNAADIAGFLGDRDTRRQLDRDIARLEICIRRTFWNARRGFIHTLNHIGVSPLPPPFENGWQYDLKCHPQFGVHYQKTYVEKIRRGPSGPSRQANALALLAGLASPVMKQVILDRVFDNPRIPPVVTAYFSYYEQTARALCGDPAGAILHMRDYVGHMLETEDSATLWEFYDPTLTDMRRYSIFHGVFWAWPVSLCHGWGAGAVPIAARHLLGIEPTGPGFETLALKPCLDIRWSYQAEVPTPRGLIRLTREKPGGEIVVEAPKGIRVMPETNVRSGGHSRGFNIYTVTATKEYP